MWQQPPNAMTKGEPTIRVATATDVPLITSIVQQAYRHYIARMGKPPGPMLDDYAVRVREGAVWVIEQATAIFGIIVLLPASDYLLLNNIAVAPERQGLGIGRRLLNFAEAEALRRGYRDAFTLLSVMRRQTAPLKPVTTAYSCANNLPASGKN